MMAGTAAHSTHQHIAPKSTSTPSTHAHTQSMNTPSTRAHTQQQHTHTSNTHAHTEHAPRASTDAGHARTQDEQQHTRTQAQERKEMEQHYLGRRWCALGAAAASSPRLASSATPKGLSPAHTHTRRALAFGRAPCLRSPRNPSPPSPATIAYTLPPRAAPQCSWSTARTPPRAISDSFLCRPPRPRHSAPGRGRREEGGYLAVGR